jgi:hypothetical protein
MLSLDASKTTMHIINLYSTPINNIVFRMQTLKDNIMNDEIYACKKHTCVLPCATLTFKYSSLHICDDLERMLVPCIFLRLVSVGYKVPVLVFFIGHDVECGAVHIHLLVLFVYCSCVDSTQIQVKVM